MLQQNSFWLKSTGWNDLKSKTQVMPQSIKENSNKATETKFTGRRIPVKCGKRTLYILHDNDNLTPLFGASIWLLWLQASFCWSCVHSVVLPTLTTAIRFFQVDFEVHIRYRFCALKGMKINPVSSVCLTSKVYGCGQVLILLKYSCLHWLICALLGSYDRKNSLKY